MKRILLAYNPVSGHAAFKSRLDAVIDSFQKRGVLLSVYRTCAGDNSSFAECVKLSGAEGVIAAGGDGTLHDVINWLKRGDLDLPVGIIGSGTSNDFATHLELNEAKVIEAVVEGRTRRVDLGLVNDTEYFINVASAGVFTNIAHAVDSKLKNFLGKGAYYLRGLGEFRHFRTLRLEIDADGRKLSEEAFLFLVLNSSSVAGFKRLTTSATIDDGRLDLFVLKKCSASGLIALAKKILAGGSVDGAENVLHLQAAQIEINSVDGLTSDLDGEAGSTLPLRIETLRHALEVFS